MIGVTFESQVRVRLGFKIFLEVGGQSRQGLLLARQQTAIGIFLRRLSGREVNAVQREAGFETTSDPPAVVEDSLP